MLDHICNITKIQHYMLLKRRIFAAPLPHFLSFLQHQVTASFAIFAAPLPHFLAKLLVRCRTILPKKTHQMFVPGWHLGPLRVNKGSCRRAVSELLTCAPVV